MSLILIVALAALCCPALRWAASDAAEAKTVFGMARADVLVMQLGENESSARKTATFGAADLIAPGESPLFGIATQIRRTGQPDAFTSSSSCATGSTRERAPPQRA
jgi:hypothetical protein